MLHFLKLFFLVAFLMVLRPAGAQEDRAVGTDPLEPQFNTPENYPKDATEADLKLLDLTDPKLRVAYYWLIKSSNSGSQITDKRTPELMEILKDIRRRGDSATPLWLDMMAKNPGSNLEWYIPNVINRVGTIKMEPYVDYLRKMLQTRPDKISGTACGAALSIFFEHGTREDLEMVQELAKKRPFLAPYVETAVAREQRRTAAPITTPSSLANPSHVGPSTMAHAPESHLSTNPKETPPTQESGSILPWTAAAVGLSIAGIGLFWVWRKGCAAQMM